MPKQTALGRLSVEENGSQAVGLEDKKGEPTGHYLCPSSLGGRCMWRSLPIKRTQALGSDLLSKLDLACVT